MGIINLVLGIIGIHPPEAYFKYFMWTSLPYYFYRLKKKDTEELITTLKKRYKKETKHILKGWLVFLYILLSLAFCISTMLYAI